MNKSKTLKAIALSLGLAAMMTPATMNAQINHGLLQNPYKTESNKNHSMLKQSTRDAESFNISNGNFNEQAPIGSGIAILMGLGLGYVALKRKEDEQ